MIQVYKAMKASIEGKPIKQCDIKCLQCGWTVLFTESALKFIVRLNQGAGRMAQWVKAHTADPKLHPQDPRRVRREPCLQIHPLTSTPTYSYTHNIKEYKKNCFQKS